MAAKKSSSSKSAMKMNSLQMISWVIITVGAINWGLVGIANLNLVEALLGAGSPLTQIVYIIVGLSGIYSVWGMFSMMNK